MAINRTNIVSKNHDHLRLGIDFTLNNLPQTTSRYRALLLSPNQQDIAFVKRNYPNIDIWVSTRADWNLDKPLDLMVGQFDLAIASNVFHYSSSPQIWLNHILSRARYLVVQDLVYRKRSASAPFLGTDGDRVRYSCSKCNVVSPFPGAFDWSAAIQPILYFRTFVGGTNELHTHSDPPIHLVMVAKSTVRIDDLRFSISISHLIRSRVNGIVLQNIFARNLRRCAAHLRKLFRTGP
jgi:hypothetical protein